MSCPFEPGPIRIGALFTRVMLVLKVGPALPVRGAAGDDRVSFVCLLAKGFYTFLQLILICAGQQEEPHPLEEQDMKIVITVEIPVEPFFLKFNASCKFDVATSPDDLARSGLEDLGKKWA